MSLSLRKLTAADSDAVAVIHRTAFDDRLPWLAGLHTLEEDRCYFRERVFPTCEVWGAFVDGALKGFIAFREGWVQHLYVLPEAHRRGLGSALLERAKLAFPCLSLWTFQRNEQARRFYESRGFVLVRETDGASNEEREPDVLYTWSVTDS